MGLASSPTLELNVKQIIHNSTEGDATPEKGRAKKKAGNFRLQPCTAKTSVTCGPKSETEGRGHE